MKGNGALFKRKLSLVICSRVKEASEEALMEDQVGGTRLHGQKEWKGREGCENWGE